MKNWIWICVLFEDDDDDLLEDSVSLGIPVEKKVIFWSYLIVR